MHRRGRQLAQHWGTLQGRQTGGVPAIGSQLSAPIATFSRPRDLSNQEHRQSLRDFWLLQDLFEDRKRKKIKEAKMSPVRQVNIAIIGMLFHKPFLSLYFPFAFTNMSHLQALAALANASSASSSPSSRAGPSQRFLLSTSARARRLSTARTIPRLVSRLPLHPSLLPPKPPSSPPISPTTSPEPAPRPSSSTTPAPRMSPMPTPCSSAAGSAS